MSTVVLIVDAQQEFVDKVTNKDDYMDRMTDFLVGVRATDLPVIHIVTEGHGQTIVYVGLKEDIVTKKNWSPFEDERLDCLLEELDVDTVIIAGLYTHACIQQTAIGCHERGLKVIIVEDCVESYRHIHGDETLKWMSEKFAEVKQADDIISLYASIPLRLALLAQYLDENKSKLTVQMVHEIKKDTLLGTEEIMRALKSISASIHNYNQFKWNIDDVTVKNIPLGKVGIITPFNNPIAIPIKKIASALLGGNKVIWKCSEDAQKISIMLHDLIIKAGLGELVELRFGGQGVVHNLINEVQAISYTGSGIGGRWIRQLCEPKNIRFQGELETQNSAIVTDQCDLAETVDSLLESCFGYGGQRCTATRKIFVEATIKKEFIERFLGRMTLIKASEMCTLQRANHVKGLVDTAVKEGAKVLVGGETQRDGTWMQHTVLEVDDSFNPIMNQEVFGPVVVIFEVMELIDGIAFANCDDFGLMMTLYSDSEKERDIFLDSAEASILRVNPTELRLNEHAPFGGWEHSSSGLPENGYYDILFYTKPQVIYGTTEENSTG